MSGKERDESLAPQEQRPPEETQGKRGAEEKERAADKQSAAETGAQVDDPDAWDPINGHAHDTGLYGLVAFCHNYGGYYYLGDDVSWYWFDC